jgi:GH15 family glucan-1,4-alpha-glucosidase
MEMNIEVFPAFNYARDRHKGSWVTLQNSNGFLKEYSFESQTQSLRLSIISSSDVSLEPPDVIPPVDLRLQEQQGSNGPGLHASVKMKEGQSISFVLHDPETILPQEDRLQEYQEKLERETLDFWADWIARCSFRGHYREQVERSLLVLKLLTYQPTGAIVAAPTFSLPEHIGGSRNWDYRYSWVRDAAFVVYVFLKNGYPKEAEAYINFIFDRVFPPVTDNECTTEFLPIMVTIRGETDIPETELEHLEGYRGSKPVRIGNAAARHTQLDIYGELMDSVYLYNKHGRPISYEQWIAIRRMIAHVIRVRNEPDRSVWEVRGKPQNFVYSKIMLWVALDRAIRLTEKRSNLPCPDHAEWTRARDELYDEIMTKGYNLEGKYFCMSYESKNVLDAAVLIAPLVFFIAPNDPRFLHTLKKIMSSPAKGGLSVANMVSRYDHRMVDDGMSLSYAG